MNAPDHRPRVAAERRERMRARLLEGALDLVAQRGPSATSIDDVISAAGVSRGTFYKYFDKPESLVRELALELTSEIVRTAEPQAMHYDDPAQRIATGMRIAIDLAVSHPLVGAFIVRLGWPDMDRRHLMFDYARRDLEAGQRIGRFVDMPLALALNIVAGTVLGAIYSTLFDAGGPDFAAHAIASALRALGVDADQARRIVAQPLEPPTLIEGGWMARSLAHAGAPGG